MNVLAIEQSTSRNTLCVLKKDNTAVNRDWVASRQRGPQLFRLIPEALDEAGLTLPDIGLFAVGTGPGSFTGIRAAVAAIRGMALPGNTAVTGISSADIVATEVANRTDCGHICVVGDARRQRLWVAYYKVTDQHPQPLESAQLLPADELRRTLVPGSVVVSPDWERIEATLASQVPAHSELVCEPVFPDAERAARMARDAELGRRPRGQCIPIYLHPAVSTPPSFPSAKEVAT